MAAKHRNTSSGSVLFGKYRVLQKIGEGASGAVFKAQDTQLRRIVALKVLSPLLLRDPKVVESFLREARTAARLTGPHLVPVFEVGEARGYYYIAMQYMAGGTLRSRLKQGSPLRSREVVRIVEHVASALEVLHKAKAVHRDIKPSNILFDNEGNAYLGDFGLARATEVSSLSSSGQVSGTAAYLSPELARGRHVGPRSDVYSLGVVAYEMLTGRLPFQPEIPTLAAYISAHLLEPPPPPSHFNPQLSPAVDAVLLKVLAKDPSMRFPTARAFAAALRQALEGNLAFAQTSQPIAVVSSSSFSQTQGTDNQRQRPVRSAVQHSQHAKGSQNNSSNKRIFWGVLGTLMLCVVGVVMAGAMYLLPQKSSSITMFPAHQSSPVSPTTAVAATPLSTLTSVAEEDPPQSSTVVPSTTSLPNFALPSTQSGTTLTPTLTSIPTPLPTPSPEKDGRAEMPWHAKYYPNKDFREPAVYEQDYEKIAFDWGKTNPAPDMPLRDYIGINVWKWKKDITYLLLRLLIMRGIWITSKLR